MYGLYSTVKDKYNGWQNLAAHERKVQNFLSCCLKPEFVTEPLAHNWTKETQYTQSVVFYPDKYINVKTKFISQLECKRDIYIQPYTNTF